MDKEDKKGFSDMLELMFSSLEGLIPKIASLNKKYLDELVKNGFSRAEAIEIISKSPITSQK